MKSQEHVKKQRKLQSDIGHKPILIDQVVFMLLHKATSVT